jgi:predicted RNase H-like nuclease (RuvC/YqgF family)
MIEKNNFIKKLINCHSKSEVLNPNISYSNLNTTDVQHNIHTASNIPNISNLYPSCIDKNINKKIKLSKSKSLTNNIMINSKNNYMNYNTTTDEKSSKSNTNLNLNSNKNKNYKEQLEKTILSNINLESQLKQLTKENRELQNELKNERQQRKQDKKNIDLLKRAINNLISDNNKNIVNYVNGPMVGGGSKKASIDMLLYVEKVMEENNKLKEKINELTNDKKEINNIKNKIMYREKELNDFILKNEELNDKCEVLEKQNCRLNENLKNFKNFEEIKLFKESLEKKLNLNNQENNELRNKLKEKDKEINELKFMKYDDKLYYFEKELNEYKLKDEQNQMSINKFIKFS